MFFTISKIRAPYRPRTNTLSYIAYCSIQNGDTQLYNKLSHILRTLNCNPNVHVSNIVQSEDTHNCYKVRTFAQQLNIFFAILHRQIRALYIHLHAHRGLTHYPTSHLVQCKTWTHSCMTNFHTQLLQSEDYILRTSTVTPMLMSETLYRVRTHRALATK